MITPPHHIKHPLRSEAEKHSHTQKPDSGVMMDKPILCVYHANCADGFGAAWAVRNAVGVDNFEGFAATHGNPPPDVTGRDVIIVDFSYSYDVLSDMGRKAHRVLVLDHHKSARDELSRFAQFRTDAPDDGTFNAHWKAALVDSTMQGGPNVATCFDMDRSGARLAWDHFNPGIEPPRLLQHIEDRDLWRFELPGTREVQAALFSYPYDFAVWDLLMNDAAVEALRHDGAAIERKHHKDVAELVSVTKRRLVIGGYDVPVANLPYTLTSDAGHLMCQGEPFAACYWDTEKGRTFSLRSSDEGVDVAEVATQYGGGGHRNASGFRVPYGHPLTISPAGKES